MNKWAGLEWIGEINMILMQWTNDYFWWAITLIFFTGALISMSPLATHHEQSFIQIIGVWIRRAIVAASVLLISLPFIMLYVYDMTMQYELGEHTANFIQWFKELSATSWWLPIVGAILGAILQFSFNRYVITILSAIMRSLRKTQSKDKPSDIRDEHDKYKERNFLPNKYYSDKGMMIGLAENSKPILVPKEVWYETNMQVIGPTRYGKGVILGCLMDQIIRKNDGLFYIDPKNDTFAAHVMYQACLETGRPFYYVSLDDDELGKWSPFTGGNERDAFTRLETALGLEITNDPGTDYYKTQEIEALKMAFKTTKRIDALLKSLREHDADNASKSIAELSAWNEIESFKPKANRGFSIEKAIEENAVVYFKGSLDDRIIKAATKLFIVELVQECRRLNKTKAKKNHITVVVDEVSFLVSRQLKEAMATIVGFGVNFVNAYQSPEDLINTDDINLNGKALKHSIDTNSQLKAIYGGANYETAEWASALSGTTSKQVTKLERTDIKSGGGEIWDTNRTIGTLEENLIHPNAILTLPPKVCVFIQPRHLLEIAYTSFVPVKNMTVLGEYLNSKMPKKIIEEAEKTSKKPAAVKSQKKKTPKEQPVEAKPEIINKEKEIESKIQPKQPATNEMTNIPGGFHKAEGIKEDKNTEKNRTRRAKQAKNKETKKPNLNDPDNEISDTEEDGQSSNATAQ